MRAGLWILAALAWALLGPAAALAVGATLVGSVLRFNAAQIEGADIVTGLVSTS